MRDDLQIGTVHTLPWTTMYFAMYAILNQNKFIYIYIDKGPDLQFVLSI